MRWAHPAMAVATMAISLAVAAEEPDALLIHKCTTCHTATRLDASRHTWVGWWWVTARMRWINGAALGWAEHAEVVDRLARRYPARGDDARDEWLAAGFAGLAVIGLPAWLTFRRRIVDSRHRNSRNPYM
jgi:hypothetical protein